MNRLRNKFALRCESLEDRRLLAVMVGDATALRAAVAAAAAPGGDPDIVFTADITLGSGADAGNGELSITAVDDGMGGSLGTLNIDGAGFSLTQTTAGARVMNIEYGGAYVNNFTVNLSNMTITGGDVTEGSGGGIRTREITNLVNVTVSGNTATASGGNIYGGAFATMAYGGGIMTLGTLTLEGSTITGNEANSTGFLHTDDGMGTYTDYSNGGGGGGISTDERGINGLGILTISNSVISNNATTSPRGSEGGGIRVEAGAVQIEITNSTISQNSSLGFGGLAPNDPAGSASAFPYGGGAYVGDPGVISITNSDFTNNFVGADPRVNGGVILDGGYDGGRGGGLRFETEPGDPDAMILTITGGSFSGNTSNSSGGGIAWEADALADIDITGVTFDGNQGSNAGGAINELFSDSLIPSTVDIVDSMLINNTATGGFGGGAMRIASGSGELTITDTTVTGSFSGDEAGAFDLRNVDVLISNSTISGNSAVGINGAIDFGTSGLVDGNGDPSGVPVATMRVENSTVSGNSSGANGAIGAYDGTAFIFQSTISGNTANGLGGGFYGQIRCDGGGATDVCYANTALEAFFYLDRVTVTGAYQGAAGTVAVGAEADLVITNSLITGNNGSGANGFDVAYTIGALGNGSLDVDYTLAEMDGGGFLTDGVDGNIVGVAPNLGGLANNGGPTYTHALMSGPGENAADPSVTGGTDQRGYGPRDYGGRMDMGAYELGATDVTCAVVISGDLDCSGQVGAPDLDLVLSVWGQPIANIDPAWVNNLPTGPLVGAESLDFVLNGWGNTMPPAQPIPAIRESFGGADVAAENGVKLDPAAALSHRGKEVDADVMNTEARLGGERMAQVRVRPVQTASVVRPLSVEMTQLPEQNVVGVASAASDEVIVAPTLGTRVVAADSQLREAAESERTDKLVDAAFENFGL